MKDRFNKVVPGRSRIALLPGARVSITALVALLVPWLCPVRAEAQLALRWFSIDGGGGWSAAGEYSLQSSIGQPDGDLVIRKKTLADSADALALDLASLSEDYYAFFGGFLPGSYSFTARPYLRIRREGPSILILSWLDSPLRFVVFAASHPDAPEDQWTALPGEIVVVGNHREMVVRSVDQLRFFRLVNYRAL